MDTEVESVIQKSLEGDIVLFVSTAEEYKDFFKKIISIYLKKKNKLCIVSLNENYNNFSQELKKNKINPDTILFIDCVSKSEKETEEEKNVIYISSPGAFTEMSIAIKNAFKAGIEDLIFDSLSTPFIYSDPSVVFRFAQDLIKFARENGKNVFFTIKKDDIDNKAVRQIRTLVGKVTVLGKEISMAQEDVTKLMEELFGPDAGKLVTKKYASEVKTDLLLKDFKNILSKLVGPENAEKQMGGLYEKYGAAKQK